MLNGCAGIPSPVTNLHQTSALARRPDCNAALEVARIDRVMTDSKPELTSRDRNWGWLTTPPKHLSSEFHGPGAWTDTGCNASGIGTPVRPTQHSTDDLYTIDVKLACAFVNGQRVPAGKYIRLEVRPGWPAHESARNHEPQPGDVIRFSGPLIWDGDKRERPFENGHMEIHPVEPIEFTTPDACPS